MGGYVSILSALKTQRQREMVVSHSVGYTPGKPVTRALLFLLNLSLTDQTLLQHRITHKPPAVVAMAHAAHKER